MPEVPLSLQNTIDQGNNSWVSSILVILIGAFMSILDSSIVNVAIPTMMNDFHSTMSRIQWVNTIYMLTLGVIVPTSGWLGERLGLKRLYVYSLIVFTIGSALCSFAWSENVLILARVVQAIGGGMIMPTSMSMLYAVVPRPKIGTAMGMFGFSMQASVFWHCLFSRSLRLPNPFWISGFSNI